jgi:hypothetical protein
LEILDLRHFSSVDLRLLLQDETQLWSRLLSWDYSGSAEMILRYVDAKILPGYAAVDRGRVFGYSFFVYEGSKGVIGDLYVINGNRLPNACEVELKLLTHVIETLQQSPGIGGATAGSRGKFGVAPVSGNGIPATPTPFYDTAVRKGSSRECSHAS